MELNVNGKWWFPREYIQLPGTLIFDDEQATLTISGAFLPTMETYAARNKEDFIILGELEDGRKVTLIPYYGGNKQETIGQQYIFSSSEFNLKFIILGTHFQNVEDVKFESCLVEYSNLSKWIRFELDNKSLSVNIDKERVYWTRYDKSIDLNIENVCSIQIFSSEKVSFEQFTNESEVSEKVYVRFDKLLKDNLEECLELMGTFRDFLNFTVSDDVKTISFKGLVKTKSEAYDSKMVQVLWRSPISTDLEKGPGNSCLFRFDEIKDEFDRIVNAWFNFKSEFSVVYDLYFGVMYNSDLYLTNKFLMVSEALEVYHAKVFGSKGITKTLKEVYNRIMPHINNLHTNSSTISTEDFEILEDWMNNGKRPSLSARIEELYDEYSEIIPYLSLKIGNSKCFASKVSKYRNGLTHGIIEIKDIDDSDLFWTYKDLHLLLRLCILSVLGFPIDKLHTFCHTTATKAPYSLKEIMTDKRKTALEFFDRNTEIAYTWSSELTKRCDLPQSIRRDPDLLLKIVDAVQICVDNEENGGTEGKESKFLNIDLEKIGNDRKQKFFEKLYTANEEYLKNLTEKNEKIGVSLALWSGCYSAVKTLSKEENGGPRQEIRGRVFQMIEKIASERPIFGNGVEVALLWKINHGKGSDIQFAEEVIDPRIKKYEKLYISRMAKI